MVQLTVIRLYNYREWTHVLGEDREHKLQTYQADFYKTVQEVFSKRGGFVFPGRYDELFAITNGISIDEHRSIQFALSLSFPVDVVMFVSSDESPMKANENIFKLIKSVQYGTKERVFGTAKKAREPIYVIHADIEGQTTISNTVTPFETSNLILSIYQKLSQFFMERNSLAFYMGGDNFIIISDCNARDHAKELVRYIEQSFGITMNCGIGKAGSARKAIELATTSLDSIREYRILGQEKINIIEAEYLNNKLKVCAHLFNKSERIEFIALGLLPNSFRRL
jgi:GTP cyclohydrolase IIa